MSYDVTHPRDPRFSDLKPSLLQGAAIAEANRCLYCFDAPCMNACPTHIDVPTFIKKIASGNRIGSARTILDANILGASCARACPVEVLCEGACVLHHQGREPIQIGLLQRYAMEGMHDAKLPLPFTPAEDTGKRVALIGAGPASLACAAELRRNGIAATIYDARPLPGGLNTYGIAEYKLPFGVALHEVELIRSLGVEFVAEMMIDSDRLAELEQTFDAVFLGMGLGAIHRLDVSGEDLPEVTDALDLIAGYKGGMIGSLPSRVVVVGAGNTAIDAAIAAKRLGAAEVTMVYRRGPEHMSAFASEYHHALREGIGFAWFVQPVAINGNERVEGVTLVRMEAGDDGSLGMIAGSEFLLACDCVVLAIGQGTHTHFLTGVVETQRGRVVIDRVTGQTSHAKYFAGGDCTNGGREVVDAVADGKRAGIAMAAQLLATPNGLGGPYANA
ncbi:NADPH-dependent glutamate synthase beta chain-like oxidoreductase [Terriglobus roseus DSM 18391]|uniref:NADPH-dependent glutamate synthase beta chain-like oxidoreductase n=1 Tax=Terriglobus roseus (strain DSM 18391 / NRRL B-41598 / KBS 63) TaxID=926566 RepID=I3ZMS3_TERRK|nr:NAD(P)-dependent oxidoreductase [Terriglobus roseus]AFL90541.1 NADPH-dependent glutamate synthase beta chain-like oxidoreductase [Terriglobus roseus DSM 18391]